MQKQFFYASPKQHLRKLCLIGMLVFAGITIKISDACSEPIPHPDGMTETCFRYQSGPYILDTLGHRPYPFVSLAITVDKNEQGHLQSYVDPSKSGSKMLRHNEDGIIFDWAERTRYLTDGKHWTQLSLEGAKKLWGEPRSHNVYDHQFYTFDAHSIPKGLQEENLYHLDLGFTKSGVLMGYRVRGIGINKPQWVIDPAQTWVIEHIERTGEYE